MNQHLHRLKVIAAQVAGRKPFPGLKDFTIDQVGENDSTDLIAAKVLMCFCIDDGRYNNFGSGILLAIQFLDETHRPPQGDQRSRSQKDLRKLLDGGCALEGLLEWIARWYG